MNENIRIRQRRMDLGMSQEELAELVGYTGRSAIARIESGRNKVSISKIPTFAKALHTTEAYLLGVEEAPPAEAVFQYAYNSTSDTAKALKEHLISAMKLLEQQPQVSDIADKYNRLTPANQKSVMALIDSMLLEQQKAHPIKSDEVG